MTASLGSFFAVLLIVVLTLNIMSYAPMSLNLIRLGSLSVDQAFCIEALYEYFKCRTALECAKYAVKKLRKSDYMNNFAHAYMEILERGVRADTDNTMPPEDFCDKMEEKVLQELREEYSREPVLYLSTCDDELREFRSQNENPDTDFAVIHALVSKNFSDFERNRFALEYMKHIYETLLIKEDLDPLTVCKKENPSDANSMLI